MKTLARLVKEYWPSALCLAVILYATLTSEPLGDVDIVIIPHLDWLIHAVMMGGLTGAIAFDYLRADRERHSLSTKIMLRIALAVMAYGVVDEVVQAWLDNGRFFDIFDIFADWAGTWVAFFTAPPAVRKVLGVSSAPKRG